MTGKPCNPSASVQETASERSEFSTPLTRAINVDESSLAYTEMRLIFARMLWNFDMELMEDSREWSDQKVRCLVRSIRNKTDSMTDLHVMGEEAPERQVESKASIETEDGLLVNNSSRYLSGSAFGFGIQVRSFRNSLKRIPVHVEYASQMIIRAVNALFFPVPGIDRNPGKSNLVHLRR